MRDRSKVRRRTLLLSVVLVSNLLTYLPSILRQIRLARRDVTTAAHLFLDRIEPLREHLPDSGIVGYVQDPAVRDTEQIQSEARLPLFRYGFAPLLLVADDQQTLVVFDSDNPDAEPEPSRRGGWTLLHGRPDGIKLYRCAPPEG